MSNLIGLNKAGLANTLVEFLGFFFHHGCVLLCQTAT